jgi:mRNA-degrading endonuclease HigB of HigAB toxin-antitoxin module
MISRHHADHCSAKLARVRRSTRWPQRPTRLKAALDAWFHEVKKARWSSAADVKRSYATASIVSAGRIVFNIKGNTTAWSWP